jgi:creatinine amidohydrolase
VKSLNDILWSTKTREESNEWAQRGTVVIVPIGSIEQHGLHLPIDTDCRTVEQVAHQAARLADDVPLLVTPLIPFGVSPHHMMFGGTISLRVETTIHVLRDVVESIVAHGFDRVLILSGHGGNGNTIGAAALELKHVLGRQIQACCWFDLVADTLEAVREGPRVGIGHSGELETSCILAISPELVHCDHRMRTVEGISDDPSIANASKGATILAAAAEAVGKLARTMAAAPGRQIVGITTVTK